MFTSAFKESLLLGTAGAAMTYFILTVFISGVYINAILFVLECKSVLPASSSLFSMQSCL
jgi:hypothetical protein